MTKETKAGAAGDERGRIAVTSITTNADLYREFKTICTRNGVKIKDVINEFIQSYVNENKEN